MIEPRLSSQESDSQNENDDSLCVEGLPNEVSCELEVFNVHNKDLSDNGNSINDNVETTAPPTSKKGKKGKSHEVMKWEKKHLNPKATLKPNQDKRAQVLLLEYPKNVGLAACSSGYFMRKCFQILQQTDISIETKSSQNLM